MDRDSTQELVARFVAHWRASVESMRSTDPESARVLDRLLDGADSKAAPSRDDWDKTISIAESLRDRIGQDVDPGIELVKDEARKDVRGDVALVRAMRERGPASRRYDVKEEIGRGGMGAVLRVYDRELHRNLAMKILLDGKGELLEADSKSETQRLARFLEEAQVTAQLDHPGIVPVHELGIDGDGRIYFTMKLVKGENLSEIFHKAAAKVDGWNQTRVLWTLLRVCEAMDFAHRRHVVHRDLKPSNIMVGEFGEAYVMDFGLARVLDRAGVSAARARGGTDSAILAKHVLTTRTPKPGETTDSPLHTGSGERLGTPAYMAPEQARGDLEAIGPHTDVYALGAILYHLLAGSAPYLDRGRQTPMSIIERVIADSPPPLYRVARKVNPELQSICEKAMAREIGDRYASMADLAADLRAYLENRVVRAHRAGAFVELRKWVKRNRGTAYATLAAAGVALFALAAVVAVQVLKESALAKSDALLLDRQRTIESTQSRLEDIARQQIEGEANLDKKNAELSGAEQKLEEANRALAIRQTEIDGAKRDVLSRNAELESRNAELTRLENDLKKVRGEVADQTDEVKKARGELEEQRRLLAAATTELETRVGEEERVKADLERIRNERDAIAAERQRLESEVRPIAELMRIVELEDEVARLWPARPETLPLFDSWLTRSGQVLFGVERALQTSDGTNGTDPGLAGRRRALAERSTRLREILVPDIERRRAWARVVREVTIDDHRADWDAAVLSIADQDECPEYRGLVLEPVLGLVPLGRNPVSGLHEFWLAESGEQPARAPGGGFDMAPESGIVLVLLPGAVFEMGARELDFLALPDARGRRDEQPAHPIELPPFFVSKYELTQFQWTRCGGPSIDPRYRAGERVGGRAVTPANPIESVSWEEARRVLDQVKLELPTEAQWEYAARGGTETPWWCGLDSRDAWHAGNVADEYARIQGGDEWIVDRRLDDGYFVHAPVGSFRPNPFGLHDVIGNVAEWCADAFGPYSERRSIGRNGLHEYIEGRGRVARGGSFRDSISDARSSARYLVEEGARADRVGLRPVMAVEDARR